MLNELQVSSADALNLSSNACEEFNFKVPASDTLNSWSMLLSNFLLAILSKKHVQHEDTVF